MSLHAPHRRLAPLALLLAACALPPGAARLEIPPKVAHAPRVAPIDVEHYALDLSLDPAARSLSGTCRVRFYPRSAPVARVELDLEGLTVERVADERGRELRFAHAGRLLAIELAEPLAAGDSAELAIRYGGTPRRGLWFAAERDGVPTQAFTQGECEDAHAWFPCVDEPSERATSELRVELPAGWTSIAAGERVESRELPGGRRSELWRMHTPHPAYLTTLVAGEFALDSSTCDGVPLLAAVRPQFGAWLDETFAPTAQALEFLGDLTGVRYPYPKYAQACVDGFPFGGMENVSATTLTETCVQDELGRRDGDATGLIVHEAAHQWFGDLLTCADWSHIWLNEGFATYCTSLYVEATGSRDDFLVAIRDMQDGYLAKDVGALRRPHVWNVYREPMDLFFDGQAYPGGASRLHLLRFQLGDEAFFRGLRRYVADNAGRAVVTDDFRRALEQESGLDLRPFFAQWFTQGAGYPEFDVRWDWDKRRKVVRVDVEQVQKPDGATPAVFTVPVDIEVREASGGRTTRVTVDERRESFELAATTRPLWVAFDEHGWIPKRLSCERPLGEWLALAGESDDPNLRREALVALGKALAESSGDLERWQIAEAMLARLADPCKGVRATAARAFARIFTPADNPITLALMRTASCDAEAGVRVAALETLAAWPKDAALAAFGREQYAARYSYATMAAAAALVVASEGEDALPWLEGELAQPSPHEVLRSGLLGAAARLADSDVTELLARWAFDEQAGDGARATAVRLLAPRRPPGEVRRKLVELLVTTRDYHLQGALIDALATIADPQSLAALRQFHARSVDSRQRRTIEAALERREG